MQHVKNNAYSKPEEVRQGINVLNIQEHHVTNSHSKVLNLELNLTSVESQTRVSVMPACSYTTEELYSVLIGLAKAIKYTKTCLEAILLSSKRE